MSKSLFSSAWYRVAELKPRLRTHTAIHRQVFRGKTWYVLQDHQTGRFHRLSPIANLMLCLMDGRRTMREIWEAAGRKSKDDPPTQDETINLLGQLHAADLLQGDFPPDFDEMAERLETSDRRRVMQRLRSPLALRVPLFDPDKLLNLTMPLVRPLFTVPGFLAWFALVMTGLVLAILHWPDLTLDVKDRVLATENVLLIMCVYPVVKSLHELGHAYSTKAWGGEVHEVGVMLLVFIPVLYVDASASAAFPKKYRRIVVGAAGILVEMALAAIAVMIWLYASPGLGRTVAFNIILIGGVSTILFNGNPLLRFDGYYIFSDLIEIPNLATRANAYFIYLVQHHLLKIENIESPVAEEGERKWLLAYAVLSVAYRLLVSLGIALFLSSQMFVIGTVMAIWALATIAIVPLYKGLKFLLTSPRLQGRRRRAFGIVGAFVAVAWIALFVIPLPYATVADGVVIVPEQAEVRARTEGFVDKILRTSGSKVASDEPLVALKDPTLDAKVAVTRAQLNEIRQRADGARQIDRVQTEMLEDQANHLAQRLDDFQKRQRELTVVSHQRGDFVVAAADDLPGRFAKRGDLLGYVIPDGDPTVRVVVSQADVDLIARRATRVEASAVENLERTIPARILRSVPAAQQDIPSLALTTRGGGSIALDPSKTQKPQSLFSLFLIDVQLLEPLKMHTQGSRVYVRFDHGNEPLGWRVMRGMRQFFLGHFRV